MPRITAGPPPAGARHFEEGAIYLMQAMSVLIDLERDMSRPACVSSSRAACSEPIKHARGGKAIFKVA